MIAKSFSPATVSSVKVLDKEGKRAQVIVPDDQLAMAIGREGQNIRLASRLTGWEIEVKSEGQRNEENKRTTDTAMQDLLKIDGIGSKVAETLITMNVLDIPTVAGLTEEELCSLEGIGEKTAQKILAGAKKFLEENPNYGQQAAQEEAPAAEEVKNDSQEEGK
jgi:N utilization substance protein A